MLYLQEVIKMTNLNLVVIEEVILAQQIELEKWFNFFIGDYEELKYILENKQTPDSGISRPYGLFNLNSSQDEEMNWTGTSLFTSSGDIYITPDYQNFGVKIYSNVMGVDVSTFIQA